MSVRSDDGRPKWRLALYSGITGVALVVGLAGVAPSASATETPAPTPAPAPATDPATDRYAIDEPLSELKAVALTSFDAADIISDRNMYSGSAMDVGQVQSFLSGEVALCQDGHTCLKDYRTDSLTISTDQNDGLCDPFTGRANETAASIIARVGAACGVSQKALLTLMQRESQLVDDSYPVAKQYDQAMGFDCPDSGPCNPDYQGFFKQVYWAAWQLADYRAHPEDLSYPVGVASKIPYSPVDSCNTKVVPLTPQTLATAALYTYTPYQPNADALAGKEKVCASFGNINFWVIYTDWFGYPQIDVDRVSGADRFAGSVAIAEASYPDTADVVYVANGGNYPDALSAGPAAVKSGGPLLLTQSDSLPADVGAEIASLKPGRIVVVGGVNSVSDQVKARLKQLVPGATVDRIGGSSRYQTSLLLAQDAFGSGAGGAYVATGANFPDALSAGGAAGSKGQPVVLVDGSASTVDSATSKALKGLGVSTITIVGGVNSVSTGVQSALAGQATVTRVSGDTRYATSLALNRSAYTTSDRAFLATGTNFPDALAGSAWAGAVDAPLYVVDPGSDCLPTDLRTSFKPMGVTSVTLLGGPNSLGYGIQRLSGC